MKNYSYDALKFKETFEESFTWISGFMRNVYRFKNHTAVIDPMQDKEWSYEELNEDVNRLANGLQKKGIGEGDIVLYQLLNSPQFVLSYIAPQKLGAINGPLNCNLSPGETAAVIDKDKPKVYIYDCDILETAQRALEICENKPEVILAVDYHGKSPELPEGHVFFADFLAENGVEEPEKKFKPDMYAEVTRMGTSGTTGTPKRVPLNNVNEVLSAHDVIMHFPLKPDDRTMNMTPWFHRGGLHSGGITPVLYCGASLVVMRMFGAGRTIEYVQKYGITFLVGVPSALEKLTQRQEKHPGDLSGLRGIVTMGSPLSKEACIKYQEVLTPNIFNGYGTTETFWNSFLRPSDLPEMAGSAGKSCTDDEIRIVNVYEDRHADPDDMVPNDGVTSGEIIIKTSNKSAQSYVDNEKETKDRYLNGWYYTKDMGTWDSEHYITICGRKDDMIVSMGENIYPTQLEDILCAHPDIKDCMVTGVRDKARGECVAAYIIPENDTLTAKEVNRYCVNSEFISTYMCPRYYAFVDELPYNSTGKKLHVKLREIAAKDLEEGKLKRG